MSKDGPPKIQDFFLKITDECDIGCKKCINEYRNILSTRKDIPYIKNRKVHIIGGEPTRRRDLLDIIKSLSLNNNRITLHTNGLKINNFNYLKNISPYIDEVHLSFDGFSRTTYIKLRGKNLLHIKMIALDNLRRLNMPTIMNVKIKNRLNDSEIGSLIRYGCEHNFIKSIHFYLVDLTTSEIILKHKIGISHEGVELSNLIAKVLYTSFSICPAQKKDIIIYERNKNRDISNGFNQFKNQFHDYVHSKDILCLTRPAIRFIRDHPATALRTAIKLFRTGKRPVMYSDIVSDEFLNVTFQTKIMKESSFG